MVFNKEENKEYIYKNLGKTEGKSEKLFSSMKDVYMLAFLVGASNEKREKIDKRSSDPIKEEYFKEIDKDLMKLVVLDMSKDIHILDGSDASENEIHNLVEEFNNSGITILNEALNDNHYNLDDLISAVKKFEITEQPKKVTDISDFLFSLSKEGKKEYQNV